MKYPKGNITILVIFMLIAASAIGLLVMGYVRNMLTFSNNFFSYNKAYYLAQGGLEYQLTKIQQRGVGYQDTISLADTYECIAGNKGRSFGSKLCSGTGSIVAQGTILNKNFDATTCQSDNAYAIPGGDAIGFPLFVDSQVDPFAEHDDYEDRFVNFGAKILVNQPDTSQEIGFGIVKLVDQSGQRDLPTQGAFSRVYTSSYQTQDINLHDFPFDQDDIGEGLYYLVIFNPQGGEESIDFCLQTQRPDMLALTQVGAKSFATFRGVSVGLEARRTIELPGIVFSTVIEGR